MNRTLIGSIILLYYTRVLQTAASVRERFSLPIGVLQFEQNSESCIYLFLFQCQFSPSSLSLSHVKLIFHLLRPRVRLQRRFSDSFKNCFSYICKYMRQLLQCSLFNGNILFKNFNFLFVYNII